MKIKTHLGVLLLLSLLAVLIYSNVFSSSFQFDDLRNIVDNPNVRGLPGWREFLNTRYVGALSFALNYKFCGLQVFGYHLVNLLIHIANGFLVYVLILLLFKAFKLSGGGLIAIATALLFVAHPVQTQAVTYIVQRVASLSTLFYLLCVVAYLQWRLNSREGRGGLFLYGVALVSTVLAMKTKELAFTLPFMIVFVEFFFFGPPSKRQWAYLIPFLLTLFVIPLSRFDSLSGSELFTGQVSAISRSDYFFTQCRVVMTYLRLLVFPVYQNLDYDYPVYHSLLDGPVLVSFLFLSALFSVAVGILWRTRHTVERTPISLAAFGIFWFFITLSAESSLFPIRDVIFEHRIYLPSVGLFLSFCVAYAWVVQRVQSSRHWRTIVVLPMVVLLVIFSVATYQRNKVWQDEVTLWEDVVEKSPDKARVHNNLGNAYREQGRMADAVREYQAAVNLQSNYAKAHFNLGVAYKDQGQLGKANQEFQSALKTQPNFPEVRNELGMIYKKLGRLDEAAREYEVAIGLRPDHAGAHNNLGMVYRELGRVDDAAREFQLAIHLQPDFAYAHNNLGLIFASQRRLDDAVREFNAAIQIQPDYADAHNNLGIAYSTMDRLQEAIAEYQITLRLQPDYAGTHNNLGNNYLALGSVNEAIVEYRQAVALQPNFVMAHYNLGMLYKKLGRNDEAIAAFKSALQHRPNFPEAKQALELLKKGVR